METKEAIAEYVADMAAQLAELCRSHLPVIAKLLDVASDLAKALKA